MGKAWVTSPLGTSFIAYSDPAVAAWSWACRWPITAKYEHHIRTRLLIETGKIMGTGTGLLLKTATRRWPLRCRFFEFGKPDLSTVSIKPEKNKTFVHC